MCDGQFSVFFVNVCENFCCVRRSFGHHDCEQFFCCGGAAKKALRLPIGAPLGRAFFGGILWLIISRALSLSLPFAELYFLITKFLANGPFKAIGDVSFNLVLFFVCACTRRICGEFRSNGGRKLIEFISILGESTQLLVAEIEKQKVRSSKPPF